jgi:hypothetical protein
VSSMRVTTVDAWPPVGDDSRLRSKYRNRITLW